jgi:hypothetical protein
MGNGIIIGWIGCPPMLAGLAIKNSSYDRKFTESRQRGKQLESIEEVSDLKRHSSFLKTAAV